MCLAIWFHHRKRSNKRSSGNTANYSVHDFPIRLSTVFRAAILCEDGAAAPWWHPGGLVSRDGVLPNSELAGYGYAHVLSRYLRLPTAVLIHVCVLEIALFALSMALPEGWRRPPADGEALWLIGLFTVSVRLAVFCSFCKRTVAAGMVCPFRTCTCERSVFSLWRSNIGSFASLILYIILIEPLFDLGQQSILWTGGFVMLALSIAACGFLRGGSQAPPFRYRRMRSTTKRCGRSPSNLAAACHLGFLGVCAIRFARCGYRPYFDRHCRSTLPVDCASGAFLADFGYVCSRKIRSSSRNGLNAYFHSW